MLRKIAYLKSLYCTAPEKLLSERCCRESDEAFMKRLIAAGKRETPRPGMEDELIRKLKRGARQNNPCTPWPKPDELSAGLKKMIEEAKASVGPTRKDQDRNWIKFIETINKSRKPN